MPQRILTWFDLMRLFNFHNFVSSVEELTKLKWLADRHDNDEPIDSGIVGELLDLVQRLTAGTKHLQLKASNRRARKELRWALVAFGDPTWGKIKQELQVFWEILEPEMRDRRLVSIDTARGEYLDDLLGDPSDASDKEAANPVWEHVWRRFPSAQYDCEEAVYCYALERNTASIFHAMRVAEIGLRALARRMEIKLPRGKKLEWAEWQALLKEMSKKTDAVGLNQKAGPRKDEILEFYSGAIGQFTGFKDEFRNQVMHVRKSYDEGDAKKALTRVRDFMEKLANKIDEKGRIAKRTKPAKIVKLVSVSALEV
jgi:hypothetical protein